MLNTYRRLVLDGLAKRNIYKKELSEKESTLEIRKENYEDLIKARFIVAEVAKITQTKFTLYVEQLVTMAIKSIFDRPFEFKVDFDLKRNKSECFLRIQEGDDPEPFIPSQELGGGMLDSISFALRIVLWSLQNPRSSNTILLDEPFHFLGDLSEKACDLVREVSAKLNIQFIITTHNETLTAIADKAWKITNKDGLSKVELIVGENQAKKKTKLIRREKNAT